MSIDPFIREKFTRERSAAGTLAAEYFERFPKSAYRTEVESWRNLQSQNIEFTMKRLREPIESEGYRAFATFVLECRPFAKNRRRIEIDAVLGRVADHFSFTLSSAKWSMIA
jgi:hypothetical protein